MTAEHVAPKRCAAGILVALASASIALAQVPADVAAGNRAIGKANDIPGSVKLYSPLAQRPPYAEARITRDLSYGSDPKQVVDVFAPSGGGANLPVVIFISGGGGDRILPQPGAEPFFDNIGVWAAKRGLVGINIGRRGGQGLPWDAGVRDVAAIVQWVQANIGRYGGDPGRVFFMGHGLGGTLLTAYLAEPAFWGADSPRLKGVIILSTPLNVAPLVPSGRTNNPLFDPARSVLAGLKTSKVPLFIGLPEHSNDETTAAGDALRQELCRATCPGYAVFKDHQHHSLSFAFNTSDESVSGPLLNWMRGIR